MRKIIVLVFCFLLLGLVAAAQTNLVCPTTNWVMLWANPDAGHGITVWCGRPHPFMIAIHGTHADWVRDPQLDVAYVLRDDILEDYSYLLEEFFSPPEDFQNPVVKLIHNPISLIEIRAHQTRHAKFSMASLKVNYGAMGYIEHGPRAGEEWVWVRLTGYSF
jgi:hypothetical protein